MSSPFNRELVDAIKAFIPVSDRSYDPQTKIWTFVERQLTPLQTLLTQLRLAPTVVTRQQIEQQAAAQASQTGSQGAGRGLPLDAVVLQFVRTVPYNAMKKAYQLAAMELHPDRNAGNGERMATLNTAWDRIVKEIYGQS
jgi:hypothetical protein